MKRIFTFLAAHVSTLTGWQEFTPATEKLMELIRLSEV